MAVGIRRGGYLKVDPPSIELGRPVPYPAPEAAAALGQECCYLTSTCFVTCPGMWIQPGWSEM